VLKGGKAARQALATSCTRMLHRGIRTRHLRAALLTRGQGKARMPPYRQSPAIIHRNIASVGAA
jgi:hypothetical protein